MTHSATRLIALRSLFLSIVSLASNIHGYPTTPPTISEVSTEAPNVDYGSPEFYERVVAISVLVVLGGVFAGTFFYYYYSNEIYL